MHMNAGVEFRTADAYALELDHATFNVSLPTNCSSIRPIPPRR